MSARVSAPAVYDALVAEEQKIRHQMCEDESGDWSPGRGWLFGLYDGSCDGVVKSESIQRRWVKTAAWVLNRLRSSTSGELDSRLAEFERRLLEPLS